MSQSRNSTAERSCPSFELRLRGWPYALLVAVGACGGGPSGAEAESDQATSVSSVGGSGASPSQTSADSSSATDSGSAETASPAVGTTSSAAASTDGATPSAAASTDGGGATSTDGGSANTTDAGGASTTEGGSASTTDAGGTLSTTSPSSSGGAPGTQTTTDTTDSGAGGSGPGVTDCDETSGIDATKIYYVTPTGSATADGTSFDSAMDFAAALGAVAPGEMVLLQPGTYTVGYVADVANTIELSKSGTNGAPLNFVAADCGRAVFDFSFPEQAWVQDSYGFYVTGDYWYVKGIEVTRAGYQGVYVTGEHNTFENCAFHENRNTGLEINKGGAYTTVINCDAYRNYDPKKLGSMADGFGPKQTQGPGNHFFGCRAWENSDDGFDAFDSPETVVIENSWAFRNGVDVWGYGGFDGNGNGFKLGGNEVVARNRITNSVAFGNVAKGFDQNNNAGGLTILNCLGYDNGTNFGLGNPVSSGEQHLLRNNVSLGSSVSIANADAANNSWDSGPTASNADFRSLDVSLATATRNPDGTLPASDLFRLAVGSALIDAGVDVGLPFSGSAPDLGAFEYGD